MADSNPTFLGRDVMKSVITVIVPFHIENELSTFRSEDAVD